MRATAGLRVSAAALAAALLSAPVWAAQAGVQAVWVPRRVHFVYQSFTTFYSCNGLRDQIEHMLRKLGARDLKVRSDACAAALGQPEPFPGVRVTMRVLVPAGTHASGAPVAAHWRKVVLASSAVDVNQGGKCDLIEQFRRVFLPLFEARHIDMRAICVPHQATLNSYLSAEVLFPDTPPRRH